MKTPIPNGRAFAPSNPLSLDPYSPIGPSPTPERNRRDPLALTPYSPRPLPPPVSIGVQVDSLAPARRVSGQPGVRD